MTFSRRVVIANIYILLLYLLLREIKSGCIDFLELCLFHKKEPLSC